jgi:hypothetical protein
VTYPVIPESCGDLVFKDNEWVTMLADLSGQWEGACGHKMTISNFQ